MKLCMFGGTFNPPHLGHMAAAEACIRQLDLDLLLMMPDAIPPHKALPEETPSPQQRLELCRVAAAQIDRCQASDLELRRGGCSYTCETLEELSHRYPDSTLWLLMGTDMLLSFDKWRQPRRIAQLARLAVAARAEEDRAVIEEKARQLRQSLNAAVDVIVYAPIEASSTQLRSGGRRELLHPAVAAYIQEHQLYRPSLDGLRQAVRGRVSEKRYRHTLGCEKLAAALGQKYGVDDYVIRAAAILHDCTKALDEKEQLKLAKKWNIMFDYSQTNFGALIHADTGAETARREFGMPDSVVDAIRTHSVGAEHMTTAQKILYVADLCEETRPYDWAPPLRALALRDLESAVTAAMERTVGYVESQGSIPYHVTCDALKRRKSTTETEDTICQKSPRES